MTKTDCETLENSSEIIQSITKHSRLVYKKLTFYYNYPTTVFMWLALGATEKVIRSFIEKNGEKHLNTGSLIITIRK